MNKNPTTHQQRQKTPCTPWKTNMTWLKQNHHFWKGDTSSNGNVSIVMLLFGSVIFPENANMGDPITLPQNEHQCTPEKQAN